MAPFFTVLANESNKLTTLHVSSTLKKYYPIFVDGENKTPDQQKYKYKGANCKFFGLEGGEWLMFDLDVVEHIRPNFLLSFDSDHKVSRQEWKSILKWVRSIFEGVDDYELNEFMEKLVPKPVECPEKITLSKQIEPKIEDVTPEYRFKYVIDEEIDRALFQVDKPYTDRPYTAVIRSFSKRGFLPFFTALYVCTSWGVCSNDHLFLQRLWSHLNMEGEYGPLNLEQRLKEDIEKCLPGEGKVPEAEPEVYRCDIMGVREIWSNKQKRVDEIKVDE